MKTSALVPSTATSLTLVVTPPPAGHPMTLLRRAELPDAEQIEALMQTEAVGYAATTLGYKHPQQLGVRAKSELAQAMHVSGIRPFDPNSVRAYKLSCLNGDRSTNQDSWRMMATTWFETAGAAIAATIFFLVISLIGASVTIALALHHVAFGASVGVTVLFGTLCVFSFRSIKYMTKREWKKIDLASYEGSVPAFALATAKELHMRAPQTRFFIEELQITKTQRSVDPFLGAKEPDGTIHYFEVWDEPGFEKVRMV